MFQLVIWDANIISRRSKLNIYLFLQIQIAFKDITQLTKEKTVKVIPNAIQIQSTTRGKLTFTSFTARDRAFQQVQKLWQNALQDKVSCIFDWW